MGDFGRPGRARHHDPRPRDRYIRNHEHRRAIPRDRVGNGVGTGLVEDVRIEHVRFEHPGATDGSRKGDCLRMVGNTPQSAVRRVTVIGATFTRCARSGIAIQRNVFDLIIQGNQFTQSSDQDIDSEPTGGVNDLNGSVSIIGNVFRDDVSVAQGDFAVTVGGIGGPMARVVVSGNIFEGRGSTSTVRAMWRSRVTPSSRRWRAVTA